MCSEPLLAVVAVLSAVVGRVVSVIGIVLESTCVKVRTIGAANEMAKFVHGCF
jgi:hypothetical protein